MHVMGCSHFDSAAHVPAMARMDCPCGDERLLGPSLTRRLLVVQVANDSSWSDLVLFGFVAGLFIYVGTCEITAEEFAALDTPEGRVGKPKSARFWLFGALFFGFTVVALLQLVPGN